GPLDLSPYQSLVQRLQIIEQEMSAQILEREEVVHGALLVLLAKKHLALIGKAGSAKSKLVTLLARHISSSPTAQVRHFVRLMTRFTKPEELFGPLDIPALKSGIYRCLTTGYLADCELAFLDEIFKANSAILNALLTLLEERMFDNGALRLPVPLLSLFGA